MNNQKLKALIEMCLTFEEADDLIVKCTQLETTKEKIAFVRGMFDVEIIDHPNDTPDEDAYRLLLTTVVESKWIN